MVKAVRMWDKIQRYKGHAMMIIHKHANHREPNYATVSSVNRW